MTLLEKIMFIFSRNIEENTIPGRYKPSIERIYRYEISGLEFKSVKVAISFGN